MTGRVGVAVVGVGGAVVTTAIAAIEMIKAGSNDLSGLPLANRDVPGLTAYRDLAFGGWDLTEESLGQCALRHGVIGDKELANGASVLKSMHPWKAAGSRSYCANIDGANKLGGGHRAGVEQIRADLDRFKEEQDLDRMVVVNLASTERVPDPAAQSLATLDGFERGLDHDDPAISPAMLYAYAAIEHDTP